MKLAAKTDIGYGRLENQDNYRAGRLPDDTVWGLICDGMGGANSGKLASQLAAQALEEYFDQGLADLVPGQEIEFLRKAVQQANQAIYEEASRHPEHTGMGTTVAGALVRGGHAWLFHAGDSRVYLFRAGQIRQLTRDHSMVQELVENGTITAQQAATHPRKNIITRALGVNPTVETETGECTVRPGDVLLLCSDGLSNPVSDRTMARILTEVPFYEAADVLVAKALEHGGQDNITVLLIGVEPVAAPAP